MKRGDSMGILFNPGNDSYAKDRNYKIYIDKTMLLSFLNEAIGTPGNCIAVSHARRFGKSHAAGMVVILRNYLKKPRLLQIQIIRNT